MVERGMNEITDLPISRDYQNDFDAEWYLDTYYSTCDDGDFLSFILKSFHRVFHTGLIHGKTLLDIGTGPSIHSIISPSQHFEEIYLTDYAECNRTILKDWIEGNRQNGLGLCDSVIQMENSELKQTKEERSAEIIRKIQAVLPVDVTKSPPLNADDIPLPDTITSCLCLEAACSTLEEYNQSVHNIGTLLSSGCNLVVLGVLNQSFYRVGDVKFLCLSIDKDELRKSYIDNGFAIKFWEEYCPPEILETDPEFSDFQTAFIMHAVKI